MSKSRRKNTAVCPEGKPVRMGRLGDAQLVRNQKRHHAANAAYVAARMQVTDQVWATSPSYFPDGMEVTPLFTVAEFRRALKRRLKNPEDVPVADGLIDSIRDALD